MAYQNPYQEAVMGRNKQRNKTAGGFNNPNVKRRKAKDFGAQPQDPDRFSAKSGAVEDAVMGALAQPSSYQNTYSDAMLAQNQPTQVNPISDPNFVKSLQQRFQDEPTQVNPISDPDFVKSLQQRFQDEGRFSDPFRYPPLRKNLEENLTSEEIADRVLRDRLMGSENPAVNRDILDFMRQSEREEDQLIEDLNRMGVLRGGDTAEALGDLRAERGRTLADMEARKYDQQSDALRNFLDFQRGEREERLTDEEILSSGIGREIAEAGQTGIFRRGETQQARRQQAELDALLGSEGRAERQLDTAIDAQDLQNRIAQAGVTGMFEGEGSAKPQKSMALQAFEAEQALRGEEFDLERRLAEAEQTGRYAFGDQGDEIASRQGEITRAQEADLREQQALESDLESDDLRRRLAQAEQTGRFVFADAEDEIASRQGILTEEAEEREFRRQLAEAGLTGDLDGIDTLEKLRGEREERALMDDLITAREARRSSFEERGRKDRALDIDERRIDAEIERMKGQTRDDRLKTLSTIAESGEDENALQKALQGLADDGGLNEGEFDKLIRESLGLGERDDFVGPRQYTMSQLNEDLKSDDPSIRKQAEDKLATMLSGLEGRSTTARNQTDYTVGGRA